MAKVIKKKEQINATVSPWIKKQCLDLAKTPEFSSISDVVSLALSEFFGKYEYIKTKELKEHETRIPDLLEVLMKTKEGQEWLKSVYKIETKKINYLREKDCHLEQNIEGLIGLRVKENFVPVFIDGDIEGVTGYDKKDFLSGKIKWVEIIIPEDRLLACENLKKAMYNSDISTEIEYRILRKNGETRWVLQILQKLPAGSGSQRYIQGLIRDITKRKAADLTLKKTHEARIKEIHHRIKNNLQVISSLLSLEADRSTDTKTLEAFRESQNRVASMALIHEELYKGDEVDNLDFADYLRKLTTNLFRSYRLRNEEISLKLELEKVHLDMDTAIPLGIIVNELVSNALKYAFPAQKGGKIYVSLHTVEKHENKDKNVRNSGAKPDCISRTNLEFVLTVADNGDGFPEEIDYRNTNSLGLQIVNILVEQIEGCIELKRNNGTEFSIYFSKLV
ncbi:sensor histidine kinase [Methanosarcina sp.]|uniref:sensor histidine kinase n=1 Tax=Methanosarcina sp. TaxID=2213 RepID=UPI002988CE29|nr:histidine kinase dimerization/phosphoacceptor domain -containing protein [Methanosarcina sp.]MDW5550794.1 histidine kinase dimerization/phosphoacceptor domain -containing protein [Methanosarcina sp.]MDW5554616.1 histidine kinase dimerization/phosphoacceptor domain -containing protein [Methanosarcina sp.]MDW5560403.1 histidine kinase dimerization/phosphoacceptor domain -containing protein [Methanosarcina sp.]